MQNKEANESRLPKSPKAQGFRVEDLLIEASSGGLRIPAFQRPLRWRSKGVIDLFDSIRRGFPIGELLLSRGEAPETILTYGPVTIDAPHQHSALWVVDGQQRLTALIATLLREDKTPRSDIWAIWYDLEEQEFRLLQKREANPSWLPLNVLSDSVKQLRWIRNWPFAEDREDLVERALDLGKSIREYELPAYIVDGANQNVLRLIFTRMNTAGVRMRESEIFEALYGEEGDKPIRSAVARLCGLGFGQIDEDLFLRCLRVTCNLSRSETIDADANIPTDSIRRTETAFRRAVDGIVAGAGIPHWKLLPYRLPLIYLTAFYDKFGDEDLRVDRMVGRWIWRGAITGDHEDVTDARVTRLVKEMRESPTSGEALTRLLSRLKNMDFGQHQKNSPLDEIDQVIRLNRASGKIFVLGLLAANPKRPLEEQQLLDFESEQETLDDITNNESGIDPTKILRSITNDGKYGSDVVIRLPRMERREFSSADDATLESFLLSREAIELLEKEDIRQFRKVRSQLLSTYLARFVADRLGDDVDIRPSIKSIVAGTDR
ncbi:MAG: DUF262 domain-containing protein [Planctomycetota bacterium]